MIVRLLFEIVLTLLIIMIVGTQIIMPILKTRPIFPFFRRKKLVNQMEEANEALDEKNIYDKIERIKTSASKKNNQIKNPLL